MKAKVIRGSGFKGCLKYLTEKEGARVIGGTVNNGSAESMAREFRATIRPERNDVKKPLWHSSLTLPKGEVLSKEKWTDVVHDYMKKIGLTQNRAYTLVQHSDTDYDHVHLVVSRVALDGSLWSNSNDVYKALDATQALEKEHNLLGTKGYSKREKKAVRSPADLEAKMVCRTGKPSCKQSIRMAIDLALNQNHKDFADALAVQGVAMKLNKQSTGRIAGISFELDGVYVKGSQLGKSYSCTVLQKRLEQVAEMRRQAAAAQEAEQRRQAAAQAAAAQEAEQRRQRRAERIRKRREQESEFEL